MSEPEETNVKTVKNLQRTLEEALGLLADFKSSGRESLPESQSPLSLMEQCLALCEQQQTSKREPIRIVNHFACTGGTLLSKCIAAMPNVQLISEVNPFSKMGMTPGKPGFAPTDAIRLMEQSTQGVSPALISELFLNNLEVIYSESERKGHRLVLRDHAHSQFCTGADVSRDPTLNSLVSSRFDSLCIVSVRDPIQSFVSLKAHKWLHFQPPTFDEYCRRYLCFLRTHDNDAIYKYEDFVDDPASTMSAICSSLELPFSDQFDQLFNAFALTGDSGRGGDTIRRLEDKEIDDQTMKEIESSAHYPTLLKTLNYS